MGFMRSDEQEWVRRFSPEEASLVSRSLMDQVGGWPDGQRGSTALAHIAAAVRQRPGDQPGRWSVQEFLGRVQNLADLIDIALSRGDRPLRPVSSAAAEAALRILLAPFTPDPTIDALQELRRAHPAHGRTGPIGARTWATLVEKSAEPTRKTHAAALAAIAQDPRVAPPGPH